MQCSLHYKLGGATFYLWEKWNNKPTLQRNDLEPTFRLVHVKIALHGVCVCVCVCFACLVDVDGDLALIDPKKPVREREREREREKGEFGQD